MDTRRGGALKNQQERKKIKIHTHGSKKTHAPGAPFGRGLPPPTESASQPSAGRSGCGCPGTPVRRHPPLSRASREWVPVGVSGVGSQGSKRSPQSILSEPIPDLAFTKTPHSKQERHGAPSSSPRVHGMSGGRCTPSASTWSPRAWMSSTSTAWAVADDGASTAEALRRCRRGPAGKVPSGSPPAAADAPAVSPWSVGGASARDRKKRSFFGGSMSRVAISYSWKHSSRSDWWCDRNE